MTADHPGELVHLDVKKLGKTLPALAGAYSAALSAAATAKPTRAARKCTRITSRCGATTSCTPPSMPHSRLACSEILADERKESDGGFWLRAARWFAECGIEVQKVLADNGSCYKSHAFADALGPSIIPPNPTLSAENQRQGRTISPHPGR